MNKLFFKSRALIFERDTVDTFTLGDPTPTFNRTLVFVKAHPGVTAEDILSEVQDISDDIEQGIATSNDPILTTTLTEEDDLVVALTYSGFCNIASDFAPLLFRKRFAALANDLVRIRDKGHP